VTSGQIHRNGTRLQVLQRGIIVAPRFSQG
jgi:hypothetical protein